jgi:hypothetical protein
MQSVIILCELTLNAVFQDYVVSNKTEGILSYLSSLKKSYYRQCYVLIIYT